MIVSKCGEHPTYGYRPCSFSPTRIRQEVAFEERTEVDTREELRLIRQLESDQRQLLGLPYPPGLPAETQESCKLFRKRATPCQNQPIFVEVSVLPRESYVKERREHYARQLNDPSLPAPSDNWQEFFNTIHLDEVSAYPTDFTNPDAIDVFGRRCREATELVLQQYKSPRVANVSRFLDNTMLENHPRTVQGDMTGHFHHLRRDRFLGGQFGLDSPIAGTAGRVDQRASVFSCFDSCSRMPLQTARDCAQNPLPSEKGDESDPLCRECLRRWTPRPCDLDLIRLEDDVTGSCPTRSSMLEIEEAVTFASLRNLENLQIFLMELSASLQRDSAGNLDFECLTIAFSNEDNSIGFGIKRRDGTSSFHQRIFVDLDFQKDKGPVHFVWGFRGCYSSLTFKWESAVVIEPDPLQGQYLGLQRAARYAFTKLRAASMVRKTASLVSNISATDFGRLIAAPSVFASMSMGRLGGEGEEDVEMSRILFPMTSAVLPFHSRECPISLLRRFWEINSQVSQRKKLLHRRLLFKLLALIERHQTPVYGLDLVRFLFYNYTFYQ